MTRGDQEPSNCRLADRVKQRNKSKLAAQPT